MTRRTKKKNTNLFFDSFKHLKNNVSNLIFLELITLMDCSDLKKYLDLKPVNSKSKLPDMKKIGLIDYENQRDNIFVLTPIGEKIYDIFKKKGDNYINDSEERLYSIKPEQLLSFLTEKEKNELNAELLELSISYYDSADCIRPYLALLKFAEENRISTLDNDTLNNILAHSKDKILSKEYSKGLFENLEPTLQEEITRPVSYMVNTLKTAGIINEEREFIYDKKLAKEIIFKLDEIFIDVGDFELKEFKGRIGKEQYTFRNQVLKAYGYKCAITGKCIKVSNKNSDQYLIDAAHIIPYSESGSFSVNNGIALSFEMHKLFDRGLFTFIYNENEQLEVYITKSATVRDDGILSEINHKIIKLPNDKNNYPEKIALEYRFKKHLL